MGIDIVNKLRLKRRITSCWHKESRPCPSDSQSKRDRRAIDGVHITRITSSNDAAQIECGSAGFTDCSHAANVTSIAELGGTTSPLFTTFFYSGLVISMPCLLPLIVCPQTIPSIWNFPKMKVIRASYIFIYVTTAALSIR